MSRGVYKDEYNEKYNISDQTELRLIPYIQYLCVNKEPINFLKMNFEEVEVVNMWALENKIYINDDGSVSVSKEFYKTMCDILWDAYANKIDKGK